MIGVNTAAAELVAELLAPTEETAARDELASELLLLAILDAAELMANELACEERTALLPTLETGVLLRIDETAVDEVFPPCTTPATRHSKMPVDCVVLSMDTRKRFVVTPVNASVLNAFFTKGTLPALTQALPFQYSTYARVGVSTPPLSSNQ